VRASGGEAGGVVAGVAELGCDECGSPISVTGSWRERVHVDMSGLPYEGQYVVGVLALMGTRSTAFFQQDLCQPRYGFKKISFTPCR
jgi:hypothetical protein